MKAKNLKQSQVALSNFPFTKYSLDYTLNELQRLGGSAMEFYAVEPHLCLETCTLTDIKTVGRKLKEHGLFVVDVCPENCGLSLNLAAKDPEVRLRSYQQYVNAIHAASEWGCKNTVLFPGRPLLDQSPEEAWTYAVDAMGRLADIAQSCGVRILLEATTPDLTVVTNTAKVMQFIEAVGSPAIGGMVDLMCLDQTHDGFCSYRFTTAGFAYDGNRFAAVYGERNAAYRLDLAGIAVVGNPEIIDF